MLAGTRTPVVVTGSFAGLTATTSVSVEACVQEIVLAAYQATVRVGATVTVPSRSSPAPTSSFCASTAREVAYCTPLIETKTFGE